MYSCRLWFILLCVLSVLLCSSVGANVSKQRRLKIVIDNDAGGDDGMAIFLTLLNEKYFNGPELIALTTANGNTIEDNVCVNNQRILKVAKRQDVPIYRGSNSSIIRTPETNHYYGKDGLGDTNEVMSDLIPVSSKNAASALIELSKLYKDELIVVTIGPVTNLALAIKLDPGFLERIGHLYVAAGHIHDDLNPLPEFNAQMDVEAYHIIVQNATPDKVTLLPFSQTKSSLNFTKEWRVNTLGTIDTDIMKAQNKYEQVSLRRNDRWQSLDPSALAVIVKPDLVKEYKYSNNDIITCGDRRGINTNTLVDKEKANVRVIYSVKDEEYKQFLLDVFSAELKLENKN